MTATNPSSDNIRREIAVRAYHIWEREGRPQGREHEHWLMAETEVLGKPAKKARPNGGKANTAKATAATAGEATAVVNAVAKSHKSSAAKAAPAEKSKTEKTKKPGKGKSGKPA